MRRAPRDEVAAFPVVVEARDSPFEFLKASHRWRSTSSVDDADDISDVAPIYSSHRKLQFVHFSTSTVILARFWSRSASVSGKARIPLRFGDRASTNQ